MSNEIRETIKAFLLTEFLPGEDPERLDDQTQLVANGILDSVTVLKLIDFLEQTYGVDFEPYELDQEYLETLPRITDLVQSKLT